MLTSKFVAEGFSAKVKPIGVDAIQITVNNRYSGEVYILEWYFQSDLVREVYNSKKAKKEAERTKTDDEPIKLDKEEKTK